MTLPILAASPEIFIHDGKAVTTSLAVADFFKKTHDNILKKIRAVITECEPEYRLVNFNETSYQRENPNGGAGIPTMMFELTRDAFVLIVMGFTGKKALQWKIDYIGAFNRMEAKLRKGNPPAQYQILTTLEGDHVVKVEHVSPGKVLLHPSECLEIAKRSGYVVIHYTDLKKMTVDEFLKLGGLAEKTSGVWLEKMGNVRNF
ncbi:Rha family transcriptional regulator [Serratia fonticola]|uniref:Rha family transcriptional regulator n=1 Tax=Serratia fonticola TaxID=47917 RepID=UPI0034C65ABA